MRKEKDNEELNSIMERMENIDKEDLDGRKELGVILGYFFHSNMIIHLIITFLISYLVIFITDLYMGFISYDLFIYHGFYIPICMAFMFTLMDYLIKYVFIKYLPKIAYISLGLIFFLFYFLIFMFLDFILKGNMDFSGLPQYIIFIFSFAIIKFIISIITRRLVLMFFKGADK